MNGSLSPWSTLPRLLYSRLGVKRGVGRLMMALAGRLRCLQLLPVATSDGRLLHLDLRQPSVLPFLLMGELLDESWDTQFARSVVRSGETAVDIGANIGWYTTLLAEAVGPSGQVLAIEPGRDALRMLHAAVKDCYPQVTIAETAVSDYEGEATIHIDDQLGNASLRSLPAELVSQPCRVTTLDNLLRTLDVVDPVFIKCDVEGAELGMLRGALATLRGARPPIWMIEMNPFSAERFGYRPETLAEMFRAEPPAYEAFRIDKETGQLTPFPQCVTAIFNAVFVPTWLRERVAQWPSQC